MRCLHCNKKLSLLKLAKGDSFCSAEHFDAYQLQLSKTAYDRLVSAPDEEAPRAPLVVKPVATPVEMEADSALARLPAFRAPEPPPLPAVIPAEPPAHRDVPPYAGFLTSAPPAFPPTAAVLVAGEPDANEPVNAARDLAFPVHDVQETVCILNLYLRLGLAETPPRDWARALSTLAIPESFPGEITRPKVGTPAEIESPETEPVAEVLPVDPPEDATESSEVEPLVPVAEAAAPAPEAPFQIESFEMEPFKDQGEPAETPVAFRTSMPEAERTDSGHRLPFLVAPSFLERSGEEVRFDAAESSAPRDWRLAPVLDVVPQSGPVWSGRISQSTGFAGNTSLRPRDRDGKSIQSGGEVLAEVVPRLPAEKGIEFSGWQVSFGPTGISHAPLEVVRVATGAIDFTPPAPAPLRPIPTLTPNIDRGEILTAASTMGSLFRSVLDTGLLGPLPVFLSRPAAAMKSELPSILAEFPAWDGFSSRTWRNQAAHFPLPTKVADGMNSTKFPPKPVQYAPDCIKQDAARQPAPVIMELPRLPIAWTGIDVAPAPSVDPMPAASAPHIRLLPVRGTRSQPVLIGSALLGSVFERGFTVAPSAAFGEPDLATVASTALPGPMERPTSNSTLGICALSTIWNPCLPAMQYSLPVKFLPSRKSPILPAARAWPRLGAPPQ
jgi:hypothetical protein